LSPFAPVGLLSCRRVVSEQNGRKERKGTKEKRTKAVLFTRFFRSLSFLSAIHRRTPGRGKSLPAIRNDRQDKSWPTIIPFPNKFGTHLGWDNRATMFETLSLPSHFITTERDGY
jgi:hypothetical protein